MTFEDHEFTARVLPYVPGAAPQTIRYHLIQSAREFCRKTMAWVFEHPPITTVAGQAAYTLTPPAGTEIVRVEWCEISDGPAYVPANGSLGRKRTRAGASNTAALTFPSGLVLTPAPYINGGSLVVDLVLCPDQSGDVQWPAELDGEAGTVAAGAIASLCAMPKTDWTDLTTAGIQAALFKARTETLYHRAYAASSTRGRSRPVLF